MGGEYQNEIVWHYRRWTGNSYSFLKMHDVIFFYTKGHREHTFNPMFTPYTGESFFRKQSYHTRIKGDDVYVTEIDKKGVKENDVWEINDPEDADRLLASFEDEETLNSILLKYLDEIYSNFSELQSFSKRKQNFRRHN